ncbi:MAG: MFS transporter [Dysgonamonadaceae bacterium]|nr:MFS transporter [Dysgonamonadaceae bacterium]
MKKTILHKQLTLFCLYVAQSIPMSFFSSTVPVILREGHFSLESIGLLQFIKFPWILKLFWAPFVDRKTSVLGDYKRWIIGSELFYAVMIGMIAFLKLETDFLLIAVLMVVAITASATQDIATDALSIRIMEKGSLSLGASMQSVGGFIGALVGGGLLLIIYQQFGWSKLLLGLTGFVLIALIPLIFYKRKLRETLHKDHKEFQSASTAGSIEKKEITLFTLVSFFSQNKIGRHVLYLLLYYSGIAAILAMLRPYLVDLQYSKESIGWLFGVGGTLMAAGSSLLTGWMIKRFGRKRINLIVSFLILMATGYIWWVSVYPFSGVRFIHSAITFIWIVYGMASVVVYTGAMGHIREGCEGTDFTIQTVLIHLAGMVLAGISGLIAGKLSYPFLFGFGTVLAFISLIYNFSGIFRK